MENSAGALEVLEFLKRYDNFAIIGHEEPDGDSISSALVLARFLRRLGKTATCYSPGPFLRPEIQRYKDDFSNQRLDLHEAAIILDCSTLERIGEYANAISGLPIAVIDHHASGVPFGDIRYIDPGAPSVTCLILKLIEAAGDTLQTTDAKLLFFGLCTDTGFFRHLGANSQEVFAACGKLIAAGAVPKDTFSMMFGNRSLDSRLLLGRLLERAESRYNGRLIITWETADELETFGKYHRESDALYQQLQMVAGCEVVVLVRPETADSCSVGLRATGDVDVGRIARNFGGGGHRAASGYSRSGIVSDVLQEIVEYFATILQ